MYVDPKCFFENIGEVVGSCSFSVGHGQNTLRKVASMRMLRQTSDTQQIVSYQLKGVSSLWIILFVFAFVAMTCASLLFSFLFVFINIFYSYFHFLPVQLSNDDEYSRGCLVASTSYFERKTVANFQSDVEDENDLLEREIGFWVGLTPEGAWEGFRSFLPLSVMTKPLRDDFIAMEVVMKNGKKHAILRGLATVANDSDVNLDISIFNESLSQSHVASSETSDRNSVVEEVFENQRFQPANKRSSFRGNDPGHWSTRDFSYSSKVSPLFYSEFCFV